MRHHFNANIQWHHIVNSYHKSNGERRNTACFFFASSAFVFASSALVSAGSFRVCTSSSCSTLSCWTCWLRRRLFLEPFQGHGFSIWRAKITATVPADFPCFCPQGPKQRKRPAYFRCDFVHRPMSTTHPLQDICSQVRRDIVRMVHAVSTIRAMWAM